MSSSDLDRSIIESTSDFAIIATDLEGLVTRWNVGAESILGWSEVEMLGQPVDVIFTPEDQLQGRPEVERRRARDQGRAINERWHQRKDGSRFWASGEMFPLRDTAGAHIGFVKVLRDRTPEHLRGEELEALAGERDRLWHLSEDLMAIGHIDGTLVSINPAWERVLGWSEDELVGRRFFFLVHPDDLEPTTAKHQRVTSGRIESAFQNRLRHKNGSYRWISWNSSPSSDRVHAIGRDVTKQREAQEALARSEERYRALVEAGVSIVWRADPDGVVTAAEGLSELIGDPVGENIGSTWLERVHPDDRQGVQSLWSSLKSSRQAGEIENRVRGPDGQYRWFHGRAVPLKNPNGSVREWVGTLTDISQRRQLEDQLRQAQKMEAIGQLTGGVAHDFNNLLTVILGNAEILADEIVDPGLQGLAKMTEETASRAAELTGKLLAFGRRQTLKPEPVALDEAVLSMAGLLKRSLGGHIEINLAMKHSQSAALTDRALFESAILNLAVNARDAMPKGGTLTITTGERVAGYTDGIVPVGQPLVFVTVSDTGTGMSPEVLAHAFEPFFTTKGVGQGTGLGLAMVYGFARQSGGHVSIESREGEGTSVTITLRAVGREGAQASSGDGMLRTRDGGRLLVVEDEPSVRQFVEGQVKNLGYEVTSVATGPEAMALLEKGECFDLLFSDVVLPQGMSGVELSRRAVARCPGLKVLLTSGYSEDVFEHHGRPEEGTQLLRKLYRRKELADTLRKVLDG